MLFFRRFMSLRIIICIKQSEMYKISGCDPFLHFLLKKDHLGKPAHYNLHFQTKLCTNSFLIARRSSGSSMTLRPVRAMASADHFMALSPASVMVASLNSGV